jgi:hypothetical protein
MQVLRRALAGLATAVALFLPVGVSGAGPVPMEAFFGHPDLRSVKLSPTGRFLAALAAANESIVVGNDRPARYPNIYRMDSKSGRKTTLVDESPGDVVRWIVEWVVYGDQGHGFSTPRSRYDFYERVDKFLSTHLGLPAADRANVARGRSVDRSKPGDQ